MSSKSKRIQSGVKAMKQRATSAERQASKLLTRNALMQVRGAAQAGEETDTTDKEEDDGTDESE